ncbi:site-specific integrase [Micromonospora tarensis]|uniref:Phage integrase family protein n=1 Tax=Micromonospora tarensis TaxID=2806100 RepID=A0ABS1YA98_9ACTN|nr:hypothetical protein [Micromonospora tarensis]MBM0274303.1 hypothetical protein [Micromonospora tarensis]
MPSPTHQQAAAIVTEASNDPGWGLFVWLALTTGAGPAQLCDLRWTHVDLDAGTLTIRRHPVALDPRTVPLLRAYLAHCAAQAAILGIDRHPEAYVFSPFPDGGTATEPAAVTDRYARTCASLGWIHRLDELPHYSVTDLVAAGVDIRAFTWRLQRGLSRIQRRPRA